jgi:hypothetical protein
MSLLTAAAKGLAEWLTTCHGSPSMKKVNNSDKL